MDMYILCNPALMKGTKQYELVSEEFPQSPGTKGKWLWEEFEQDVAFTYKAKVRSVQVYFFLPLFMLGINLWKAVNFIFFL